MQYVRLIKNIMSVDLEDYYCDLPFETWEKYEGRVVGLVKTILDLFEKYEASATFFVLGYVAERNPELVEMVASRGHEIASHGYSHTSVMKMNMKSFELDLVRSLDILGKLYGQKILGFRAPFFSINGQNPWAFNIIKKYLRYDSSVFPVGFHYGLSRAPRHIYKMSEQDPWKEDANSNFFEIPMTTLRLPGVGNLPIAGGLYMRLLPHHIVKMGIKKSNERCFPAAIYIHPKDLDPKMPRISEYPWHYYWGLNRAAKKLESLLRNFRFGSVNEVVDL